MTTNQFIGTTILAYLVWKVSQEVSSGGENAATSALSNFAYLSTPTPTSSLNTSNIPTRAFMPGGDLI